MLSLIKNFNTNVNHCEQLRNALVQGVAPKSESGGGDCDAGRRIACMCLLFVCVRFFLHFVVLRDK
jgi:hypothetical protein